MNICKLNKLLVLGLVLLFLLPAAPGLALGSGNEGASGARARAAPDHNASMTISDFTGPQMSNLTLGSSGGLRLQTDDGSWRPEFPADSASGSGKQYPTIGIDKRAKITVTWQDVRNGGVNVDIYAQRFDTQGNPLGAEIPVCTNQGYQTDPSIATEAHGFVITWSDFRSGTGCDIYSRHYDINGNPTGGEIQVSTSDKAGHSRIVSNGNGDYMVLWDDVRNQFSTYSDIYAQMLDYTGAKKGTEIAVSTAPGNQTWPAIASDSKNRFIIAWLDDRVPMKSLTYAMRLDGSGNKLGGEFVVSNGSDHQFTPTVATYPNNDFIIGWVDRRNPASNIFAQRFDQNGTPVGSEMSTNLSNDKSDPVIAVNSSSYALVVWMDWTTAGDIYGQWFDPGGNRFGPETIITSATGQQQEPAIAMDPKDDIAVAWADPRSGTTQDIYARTLVCPYRSTGAVATGDLEGTNLWAWSGVAGDWAMENVSRNSINFALSIDGGATWKPVPANGSLAAAGAAPKLRIMATLSTTEELTTPVLYDLTVSYIADRLPAASLPPDFEMWKDNPAAITANASDPDLDPLTFSWSQTAGTGVALNGTATGTVTFTPDISGIRTFQVTVSDGYGASAQAKINITVKDNVPIAVLKVKTLSAKAGTRVEFDASASTDPDDNIASYLFDFGDGQNSGLVNTPMVNHTYAKDGKFTVKLTVRDDEGQPANSTPITVSVEKASNGGAGVSTSILVAAVIIIVILVAVLAVVLTRRRKPTTVVQYQPPAQAMPPPLQVQPAPQAPPPSIPPPQ